MDEQPLSLRAIFVSAESKRKELDASWDTNAASYQDKLQAAIAQYQQCLQLTDRVAMFSSNESLEDVSTGDIQYVIRSRAIVCFELNESQILFAQLPHCRP